MKEIKKSMPAEADSKAAPFKGYTMEELRYQRAMMALRKEFCKAKVIESVHSLRPGSGSKNKSGGGSKLALAGKIASKVLGNLNALDYALMGLSIFGTARKGYRLIKGKK